MDEARVSVTASTHADTHPRQVQRDWVLLGIAVLLMAPVVLLARHDLGTADGLDLVWDGLALLAALLAGTAGAGLFLHTRARGRRSTAIAAVAALTLGIAGVLLANIAPPPYVASPAPAGAPTLNGLLNAVYITLTIGSGAATLRLTAHHLIQTVHHRRPA